MKTTQIACAIGATLVGGLLLGSTGAYADAVGRIDGGLAVSDLGSATYSIPIKVPSGIAGMEPSLALAYASGGPNGLLGLGWSLDGLSVVERCSRTIAQDGNARSVQYDALDRFCLDGQRLRAISGTHGENNSGYRTELEGFARITAFTAGASGPTPSEGPQWLEIRTRDGVIAAYGATQDSRVFAKGKTLVRAWAINSLTDPSGNSIEFEYTQDVADGSYRPSAIHYTSRPGQAALYTVYFDYELRPTQDQVIRYVGGSIVQERNRLTAIRVRYAGADVHTYSLAYRATAPDRPLSEVSSVTECAGGECFPATNFGWQDGTPGYANGVTQGSYTTDVDNTHVVDIDGDGRYDLAYPSSGTWRLRFAQNDGSLGAPINTGISDANKQYALSTDYNGDGKSDLLVPNGNPGSWKVLRSTGTGLQVVETGKPVPGAIGSHVLGDVNGDGLEDLIWVENQRYVKAQFNTATGFESTVRLFYDNGSSTYSTSPLGDPRRAFGELFPSPDFNGDGKTDLWSLTVEQFAEPGVPILTVFTWKQLISTGSAFVAGSWIGRENHSPTPRSLDVNGDGNMDAVFVMDGTWQLRISEGDGTDVEVDTGIVPGRPWLQPQNFLIADYDGDGRDDLLDYKTIDGWRLMRSTGTTLAQPVLLGNVLPINVRIADFNGDGMADLLTPEGTTSYWSSWLRNGAYPGLVNSVTDGLGVQTTISYASTAAGAVHTPSSNAAFPLIRDFTGPMQVVSQVTAADGIGTNYIQSYTYQGAKLHTQGRGFLGFGEMAVSDSRNGLKTKRKFFLNFPYTGMLQEQTLATGPNVTLAQTVNTASVFGYGAGESLRYFPFTDTTTARDYELNGALVRTTVNSWTYTSDYGNLQDSVSDVYGTDGGVFSTTVHREFVNNPANWCLGLVSFEELTRTAPSQPPQTRSRTAVPDSTSCRITSETSLPGTAQQVVTGYGYDTWGNVNTVSVTGYNVTTRTTTGSYAPDGYHRRSETNAENHVTAFAWDLGKGAVTSITDPNGLVTTLQRDGFGRLTREIRPDATATEIAREWCTLGCGLTLGKYQVTTRLKTWPAGVVASSSAAIFDPFDRPLRAISNLLGGALSYVDTEYDALGRLDSRSAPYKPGEAEYSSSYDYDLLNRVTLENHPMSEAQGSGRQVVYTYSGLTTSTRDPGNRITSRTVNALGQVVVSRDELSQPTAYEHWPFGELKTVTGPMGHVKSLTYDARGNPAGSVDPDLGTWTFVHNALGERTSQISPRTLTTTFTYDRLGRPKTRVEPEGTTTWNWDLASGEGIGKLASITRSDGYAEYLVYDGVGRVEEVARDIDGTLYPVTTAYDEYSRVRTLTYPDSGTGRFAVQYGYDVSGVLLQVANAANPGQIFWQAQEVNGRGQVTGEVLGNTLLTTRAYDRARGHLKGIVTGGGTVQNLSYGWDAIDNLDTRADLRQTLTVNRPRFRRHISAIR